MQIIQASKPPMTLLDLFLKEPNRPQMIDLTGGQLDLTPEWVPWMMEALIERSLDKKIYLWSDDNLSNDYFWRYLDTKHIDLIQNYEMYGESLLLQGDRRSFLWN